MAVSALPPAHTSTAMPVKTTRLPNSRLSVGAGTWQRSPGNDWCALKCCSSLSFSTNWSISLLHGAHTVMHQDTNDAWACCIVHTPCRDNPPRSCKQMQEEAWCEACQCSQEAAVQHLCCALTGPMRISSTSIVRQGWGLQNVPTCIQDVPICTHTHPRCKRGPWGEGLIASLNTGHLRHGPHAHLHVYLPFAPQSNKRSVTDGRMCFLHTHTRTHSHIAVGGHLYNHARIGKRQSHVVYHIHWTPHKFDTAYIRHHIHSTPHTHCSNWHLKNLRVDATPKQQYPDRLYYPGCHCLTWSLLMIMSLSSDDSLVPFFLSFFLRWWKRKWISMLTGWWSSIESQDPRWCPGRLCTYIKVKLDKG